MNTLLPPTPKRTLTSLEECGFQLIPQMISSDLCDHLLSEWEKLQQNSAVDSLMRTESGSVYGGRNLIQIWPNVVSVVEEPAIVSLLETILGPRYGLVRILFFDKPPEHSWALPWHKDLRIAVQEDDLPSTQFTKPGKRYGVPHVDAPEWLLEQMVTLRIHLDEVTEENGPLKVIPGSHRTGKSMEVDQTVFASILCQAGDGLLMRPLLVHSSNHSQDGTQRHRRLIHFEFAGTPELADGYHWHDFLRPKTR